MNNNCLPRGVSRSGCMHKDIPNSLSPCTTQRNEGPSWTACMHLFRLAKGCVYKDRIPDGLHEDTYDILGGSMQGREGAGARTGRSRRPGRPCWSSCARSRPGSPCTGPARCRCPCCCARPAARGAQRIISVHTDKQLSLKQCRPSQQPPNACHALQQNRKDVLPKAPSSRSRVVLSYIM